MRKYDNTMPHADFPLGGIGTGTITLKASGELTDFQLFNRPSLGLNIPYTFFSMFTSWGGKKDARVLEADYGTDFYEGRGMHPGRTRGLPRFESSEMEIRYPFATVKLRDDSLPVRVAMTAFNPFIPFNADDSGIPGIVFTIDAENVSAESAEVLIALSMGNIHNYTGTDEFDNPTISDNLENRVIRENGVTGVFLNGHAVDKGDRTFANSAILTADADAETRGTWYRGAWYDGITDFWARFKEGQLSAEQEDDTNLFNAVGPKACVVGSTGVRKTLPAGGKASFHFVLSWYVPNRIKGWFEGDNEGRLMKNHYATRYEDALAAGLDLLKRRQTLENASRAFSDAIYGTTMPAEFIDAMVSNLAVLRSTTCFRGEDGTFLAWEGSHEQVGSCVGTCTHVWNYAQAVAYLFPELEKSARINEFLRETDAEGKMTFRTRRYFGMTDWGMYPAVDGQFGTIMRAWREWNLTGDRNYLESIYPSVLRAFDYGMREWDQDGDGIPDARQHNTYDIEFYGPNPMSAVMELGAIRAVEAMADEMGDTPRAQQMRALFEKAQTAFETICWQGEYYVQRLDDVNRYPYQFGEGCLSDQLFGQTMAYLSGLGRLLPEEHLESAIRAVFKHNYLEGCQRNTCLQRLYVAKDEPGLVICSWPNGGMPRFPFVYSDEVWTGIEYQVATLLVYEGMIDEAVTLVKAVRDRFDGIRRAPLNEMECGFYYTRAMASWGLGVALSGFRCSTAKARMEFQPRVPEGRLFWSMNGAWGTIAFNKEQFTIKPAYGSLSLKEIAYPGIGTGSAASLNGVELSIKPGENSITFDPIMLQADDALTVSL